jgi:hypothetical protein
MPTGPKGQKRPADVVANAVRVMQIATGQIEGQEESRAAKSGRLGGLKGGRARAEGLSKTKRAAIAKKAARARWSKNAD